MGDPNQTVDLRGPESGPSPDLESTPTHVGRYRVERVLGRGTFGLVFLAHDEQLQRFVAINCRTPSASNVPKTPKRT
jgi:serine/threonine protein kinase